MHKNPRLNPEVLKYLHARLHKSISTIRSDISVLKRKYSNATLNAVAQIYAEQHGESVRRLISIEDKKTIPNVTIEKPTILKSKNIIRKKPLMEIINYETDDYFLEKHIEEINRAYNAKCFTCIFVLIRKVFENLIVQILRNKFKSNPEFYLDKVKGRNHDFSVVLDNLYKNRNSFEHDKKQAIERLNQKLVPFKNDANDKAHSLYHVVENSREVEEWNINTIIALIKSVQKGG